MDSDSNQTGRLSATDRLVGQIRLLISDRGLGLGDPLPTERELGEQFQAGRNTVREALQVLRAYGMIESRPKIGAVIAGGQGEALRRLFAFHNDISPGSFRDLQGFRKILEIGVCDHLIVHGQEADFDRLDALNDRILAADSVEASARADFAFHEALIALADNRTTLATWQMLGTVIEHLMRVGKSSRMVNAQTHAAHAEIVAALRARDRIAYTYLMSRHLDYGLRFVAPDTWPTTVPATASTAVPTTAPAVGPNPVPLSEPLTPEG
ncbi:FadR family transcriptional regulator [Xinfangfangia sp. D13-10-4-6]|uniref:FadR/GntR family transcriptional regulator n=1 Tax=Pseudogemmobacter hezensis TaxID=2737662 RepID=UPI001552C699|nr:FadR/GntR family transcriptional regulator [Pseudogemmobacter hezensis]NPD14723.1 FadR family transcriptional regulator [Pseudogemmobacter hezensis]